VSSSWTTNVSKGVDPSFLGGQLLARPPRKLSYLGLCSRKERREREGRERGERSEKAEREIPLIHLVTVK